MTGSKSAALMVSGLLTAALFGAACMASAQTQRGGGRDGVRDKVFTQEKLNHDGRERMYLVHDFSRGQKAPIVIMLHGGGGNAENGVKMSQFDQIAARERFIAVYPEGTSKRGPLKTWNAGHCCASAIEEKVDDVGFISKVIDTLVASGKADPSRIYVTGMSNGAMMSHRLGRELSGKIAAIAPVVGAVFGDEAPPVAPMPAFIIVGAEDETVPSEGGPLQLRGTPESQVGGRHGCGAGHRRAALLGQGQRLRRAEAVADQSLAHDEMDELPGGRGCDLSCRVRQRPCLAGRQAGARGRRRADTGLQRQRRNVGVLQGAHAPLSPTRERPLPPPTLGRVAASPPRGRKRGLAAGGMAAGGCLHRAPRAGRGPVLDADIPCLGVDFVKEQRANM